MIGAGSTVFARNLLGDILSFPELAESDVALMDIDAERLLTSEIVANKVASSLNAHPTISVTTNRRAAIEGADYVINMIQVAGYRPGTVIDFEIPARYGLRQTIADTLGIGGIMRALRTIPVMLDMCRDMEAVAPTATFLNYVNPMAMNCWAVAASSSISTVGLCHSVQGTAHQLAKDIGVPIDQINYLCAGINHMAFYLRYERNGEDLYPLIRRVVEEGRVPAWNRVRYEMLTRLGYFVTESSEHFAEYCPWFIRRDRPDLIEQFNVPLDEYIRRCEAQIAGWHAMKAQFEGDAPVHVERSHEYGSLIIHSMETGTPRVIYGNVPNGDLIDNLPPDCCVEVPVLVDKNGLQPTRIGKLPVQLAATIQTNVNVQAVTVAAVLEQSRAHVYHAAMLDPHTAAELTLEQIHSMVDELLDAHAGWLPELH
ncbi:MAG: alpha-glucosidase/alpha-galactosidase [Armatimonadetes bacterium]|nr:alpha-glucosidase/alpha-galactosidase [Armatimonadota bacterium]MDE2206679.1 alpha-glucosidase/alpha-galactosidase [Armatimonadota bacterium]